MAVINSQETWGISTQSAREKKGKLVRVEIEPGRFVKMYEADVPGAGAKAAPPAENKMIAPAQNKQAGPVPDGPAPADDFTTIQGVGKATARAIEARGITTFAELRAAQLDSLHLSPLAMQAIKEWRNGPDL